MYTPDPIAAGCIFLGMNSYIGAGSLNHLQLSSVFLPTKRDNSHPLKGQCEEVSSTYKER